MGGSKGDAHTGRRQDAREAELGRKEKARHPMRAADSRSSRSGKNELRELRKVEGASAKDLAV